MKYLSIDIETTGLNRDFCDMIEFGAILEDTENEIQSYEDIPKFHRYLKPPRPEGYQGELYAINMHAQSGVWAELNRIDMLQRKGDKEGGLMGQDAEDIKKLIHPRHLLNEFARFLVDNGYENKERNESRPPIVDLGRVTIAGKNFFAFDWNFIQPLFGDRVCRRSIDPAIWYLNPAEDAAPPGTPECLRRAGLTATGEHTALGDAWDVIRLIRRAIKSGARVR